MGGGKTVPLPLFTTHFNQPNLFQCDDRTPTNFVIGLSDQRRLHAELSEELSKVETLCSLVWQEKKKLEAAWARQHNLAQSISRLPFEILSNIMIYAYKDSSSREDLRPKHEVKKYRNSLVLPTSLSSLAVSHFWRYCTISTPLLWTIATFVQDDVHSSDWPNRLAMILQRSGGLAVQLRFEPFRFAYTGQLARRVPDMSHRCQSLVIRIRYQHIVADSLPVHLQLPNLRDLHVLSELDEDIQEARTETLSTNQMFDSSPLRIKSLTLNGVFGDTVFTVSTYASNIVFLDLVELEESDPETIGSMIGTFPCLEVLMCRSLPIEDGITLNSPNLRRLMLSTPDNKNLHKLRAPQLETLWVSNHNYALGEETCKDVQDFMARQPLPHSLRDIRLSCYGEGIMQVLKIDGLVHLNYLLSSTTSLIDLFDALSSVEPGATHEITQTLRHLSLSLFSCCECGVDELRCSYGELCKSYVENISTSFSTFIRRRSDPNCALQHRNPLSVTFLGSVVELEVLVSIAITNKDPLLRVEFEEPDRPRWTLVDEFRARWKPDWRS